jgi:hypothetical protein
MANNLSSNPLVIDTAGAGDILAASAPIRVRCFKWDPTQAATNGQQCVVTDSAGNEVWRSTQATTFLGMPDWIDFPEGGLRMKGLKVPTLAVGKLYIYLAL